MALSGHLKCLCLDKSLNIYATIRFILENELYSSQGKQSQLKLQSTKNLKRPLNTHLDRSPDHSGELSQ